MLDYLKASFIPLQRTACRVLIPKLNGDPENPHESLLYILGTAGKVLKRMLRNRLMEAILTPGHS